MACKTCGGQRRQNHNTKTPIAPRTNSGRFKAGPQVRVNTTKK